MKRHNVILESNVEPKDNNVLWLQGNKLKKFGNTGWENIVEGDVVTTDRIENGAVTSEKISSSAFDSTLSVSGKIAPADVVGRKLTDLERELNNAFAHDTKENISLNFVHDGYLLKNGTIRQSNSSKVTDFISIDSKNKYYLYDRIHSSYDCGVCYYSESDDSSFIGSQFNKDDIGEGDQIIIGSRLQIPSTAKYIRIGGRINNKLNLINLLVERVDESASISSISRMKNTIDEQANVINALYPYVENIDSVNILNKNNIGEYIHAYIDSKGVIKTKTQNAISVFFLKIDEFDGVNKTYVLKCFGDRSGEDLKLSDLGIIAANGIEEGETVISGISSISNLHGFITNTDKTSIYLKFDFKSQEFNYTEAINSIDYVLDNIVVIKQKGTSIVYPTDYIPYTDKKFKFPDNENIPSDLVADDSLNGIISLGMVDKNGNLIGNGVSFNVGQSGGGEMSADQLNVVTSITYHLQTSVLTSESAILGNGWSGSLENGYTHTTGNTTPLEFPLSGMSAKARLLITFDVQGLSESNDVYISAGDSVLIKSYNGKNTVVAGLIYDGGNLKVTPTSNFAGTITNLKCRKLDDSGTETYTTDVDNVYCQRNSLVAGYWNVFIGSKENTASNIQDGTRNIAIGYAALNNMTVGNRNVAVGTFTMPFVKEGENNIAIGSDSIYPVTKANDSVAIGKATMTGKSVDKCTALGYNAMGKWDSTLERTCCTVIGAEAGIAVVTGNTHVGYRAGTCTNGAYNTSIGYKSLGTWQTINVVGTKLTCVGNEASVAKTDVAMSATNSTALGNGATITKSNQVVIGNNEVEEVIIGGKKIMFNDDGTVTWTTL